MACEVHVTFGGDTAGLEASLASVKASAMIPLRNTTRTDTHRS